MIRVRAKKQEVAPAIQAYREALRLAPENAEALFRLAVALYGAEEYTESWERVHEAQALGAEIHAGFLEALRAQIPEPKS